MIQSKPVPVFEVILKGPGVYPEKIPFHDLRDLFSAVQQLASGVDSLDEETEAPADSFGLLGVRRGSARYLVTNNQPSLALKNFRTVGTVIRKPEKIGEREFVLNPLRSLSDLAKKHHATILLCRPDMVSKPIATINAGTYESVARTALLKGETTLRGRIERVGGASALRCGLRVAGRTRMLICDITSRQLAQQLGQHLYDDVAVTGMATWMRTTWSVLEFQIREFTKPERKPISEFFADLRRAGGDGWDAIENPQQFLDSAV